MSYIGRSPDTEQLERMADAAERAAKDSADTARISLEAAVAAKRSARWTMFAAIASAIGIVINALLVLGWLDWAKNIS